MTPKSNREANRELKEKTIKEVSHEASHELTHELTRETILELIRRVKSERLKDADRETNSELAREASQAQNRESCVLDPTAYDLWPQFDAYIKAVIAESAKQIRHKENGGDAKVNELANKDD